MKKKNKKRSYHVEFDLELVKNPYKGTYISLEGIDGSGKSTQVKRLSEYFEKMGKKVVYTREPRKTGIIGELVHKVLLGTIKMDSKAIQYLFLADRVLNQEDVIVPALKKGEIVISDRSFWSAIVYGILDKKLEYNKKNINQLLVAYSILSAYHQFLVPDYNFFLEISLNTSMKRLKNKDDKKEIYEEKGKLKKVIEGYNWLRKEFKDEFIIIDGEKSEKEVTKEIIQKFSTY